MNKKKSCNRLNPGKFLAWKARDISAASMQVIVVSYLTIFCTNSLGMDAALVGTLLMISKAVDGIPDLFAGYLIDNTNSRIGKARPYELAIIGVWGCTVLLFSASPSWSSVIKALWVLFMYTLAFSVFHTLLNASQTSYMIRAFSNNRQVIAKVSSYGGIISMLCSIAVSVTFPILMVRLTINPGGWRKLILIYAIPMCLIGMLRFIFVKEDPTVDLGMHERIRVREIFGMLRENKYCVIYAAITGLYQISVSFGAGTYYYTYVIGDISKFGIVSMFSVFLLPVMFLFPVMIKKVSVTRLYVIFSVIALIGYTIMFVGNANLPIVIFGALGVTLLNFPLGYLGTLIVMQLASYNEYIGLPRMEGSSSAAAALAGKIGQGIGAGLCGILLGLAGFISSSSGRVAEQPDTAIMMIRCLYCVFPGICVSIIAVLSLALGKLETEINK